MDDLLKQKIDLLKNFSKKEKTVEAVREKIQDLFGTDIENISAETKSQILTEMSKAHHTEDVMLSNVGNINSALTAKKIVIEAVPTQEVIVSSEEEPKEEEIEDDYLKQVEEAKKKRKKEKNLKKEEEVEDDYLKQVEEAKKNKNKTKKEKGLGFKEKIQSFTKKIKDKTKKQKNIESQNEVQEEKEIVQVIEQNLTYDEQEQLAEELHNKDIIEAEETLRKPKNNKLKNIVSKLKSNSWRVGIALVISATFAIGALTRANKYYQKKAAEHNKEILDEKNKQNKLEEEKKTIEFEEAQKLIITIADLEKEIKPELLKGVTNQQIIDIVGKISDLELKKAVIYYLKLGKIVGLQEYFAMNKNSQYPSNKADGIIDERLLDRISDPLFGLSGNELLSSNKIPEDIKPIYSKYVSGEYNNRNENYFIFSKKNVEIFIFSKNHRLISHQKTCVGEEKGDAKYAPMPVMTSDGTVAKVHKTTPSGMYETKYLSKIDNTYDAGGPSYTILLIPIDSKTQEVDSTKFDLKTFGLAIHGNPVSSPERLKLIKESEITDNTEARHCTHGCISTNIPGFGIIYDNVGATGYITKD